MRCHTMLHSKIGLRDAHRSLIPWRRCCRCNGAAFIRRTRRDPRTDAPLQSAATRSLLGFVAARRLDETNDGG
jgi:hypothetical protein